MDYIMILFIKIAVLIELWPQHAKVSVMAQAAANLSEAVPYYSLQYF